MQRLVSISTVLGLLAVGCADNQGDGSGDSGANTDTATTGSTSGTTLEPQTDDGLDTGMEETGPPGPGAECILEDDECSDDKKCMPWSEDADRTPDDTRCCPLQQNNPDLNGERCTVEEYDGSCVDSCERNTMCLVDNPEGLEGYCRPFCDPGIVSCNGGDGTCKPFFELLPESPTVPLCMDKCDPLLQDCSPSGWHCIPDSTTPAGQSGFLCVPPPPDEPLGAGETCGLANDCAQGLACVYASRLPDCDGLACCAFYCSLPEGDAPCVDIHPELACVDWMSPDPTWSEVGVCALPS
jgi:hypothetical protein